MAISVAPLVGAWIEIVAWVEHYKKGILVAPLVGAWIEILHIRYTFSASSRSPRGSVD